MSKSRRWRFTVPLITLVVMGGLLTPLFLDTAVSPQRQNRRREAPDPVSVLATRARARRRSGLYRRRRHGAAAQPVTVRPQVDGQLIRIHVQGGAGGPERRRPRHDRPRPTRPSSTRRRPRRRRTRRCSTTPSATWSAIPGWPRRTPSPSSRPTRSAPTVAQLEAQLKSDQAAIDSAARHARLHDYRRADRRANRHPHRRRGQHRQAVRRARHRQHLADPAHRRWCSTCPSSSLRASTRRCASGPGAGSTRWTPTARPPSTRAPSRSSTTTSTRRPARCG